MLFLHRYYKQSVTAGFADEVSVVIEVGEDFEEEFDWELEDCTIYVRCGSKRWG
jgi:hypothetical protein